MSFVGNTYGTWTVKSQKNKNEYLLVCICGSEKYVYERHLIANDVKMCMCTQKKIISKVMTTHGQSKTKLYNIWSGMKRRCYNMNQKSYVDYGARGIIICDEWLNDFTKFRDWALSNGYIESSVELDRINYNGNYEPSNCRWVDRVENANNKRNNKFIKINNKTKTIAQHARDNNISESLLADRIRKGYSIEESLLPSGELIGKRIAFQGETLRIKELEKRYGVSSSVISERYRKGLREKDLVKPLNPKNTPIPIIQCTMKGEFVREFNHASEATRELGIQSANIRKCLYGERKSTGGYIWKIKNKRSCLNGR